MAKEIAFIPATKQEARGRVLYFGPSGSGKTYTGLLTAFGLAGAGDLTECRDDRFRSLVAVIDTEHSSAAKYSDEFSFSHYVMEAPFHPQHYINAIRKAESSGFRVLLIDGITHEWDGEGGVKEIVDKAKGQFGGNSQAAWSVGTPLHNQFLEGILSSDCHIVATARSRTEWVPGEDERGRKIFIKVGLEPKQRDTIEYEFDISMVLDMENNARVSKSRVRPFAIGQVVERPGIEVASTYLAWLGNGAVEPAPEPAPAAPAPAAAPAAADVTVTTAPATASEADTDADTAGEAVKPVAPPELLAQIDEMVDLIQTAFGDHPDGVSWRVRMEDKTKEWFGVGIEDLSADDAATLLQRLKATRSKLANSAAAA